MARGRKNSVNAKKIFSLWKVALYIRLSREDGKDESYSVKNQRQRLREFLDNLIQDEEMELIDIYVDGSDIIGLNQQSPYSKGGTLI